MNVLLGVTGSVAAILTPKLLSRLSASGHAVEIVATKPALYFLKDTGLKLWTDDHEWPGYRYDQAKEIQHIELRNWADALLIAPLTANTLAKLANGLCDNLLTCIVRAWDPKMPIIFAPAMNSLMWLHPATQVHLNLLAKWYQLSVVPPVKKKLACGQEGIGAMAEIEDIVSLIDSLKVMEE